MRKIDTENWTVKAVKAGKHTHGYFFTGNLYCDARKVASFEEHGTGGPMDIYYLSDDVKSDFQSLANLIYEDDYPEADALLISSMVDQYEFVKKVRRDRKKKTYFSVYDKSDDTNMESYVVNQPYSEKVVDMILKEDGNIVIANEEFDIYPDGVERVYRENKLNGGK